MSYTPEMRESIKRVETTRPARLGKPFPRMTPEEREEVLEKFHPDHRPEGFRELRVGPNKGEKAMRELVDRPQPPDLRDARFGAG